MSRRNSGIQQLSVKGQGVEIALLAMHPQMFRPVIASSDGDEAVFCLISPRIAE